MKQKLFLTELFIFVLCLSFNSCTKEYDDEEIWAKVNELSDRVSQLEKTCAETNANVAAIQKLLQTYSISEGWENLS